ncbi:hypothetical protein PUN28_004448 [Cardiocondyla obscurior]|uniref:Secreted protein n=1 Tax=Cardiocondyla obscurior TaxID=286306 RepID=A0AAW2GAU4_9HYME
MRLLIPAVFIKLELTFHYLHISARINIHEVKSSPYVYRVTETKTRCVSWRLKTKITSHLHICFCTSIKIRRFLHKLKKKKKKRKKRETLSSR